MTEKLLTAREVAELLGMSKRFVLDQARFGKLPFYQFSPKTRMFRRADVEAYIESHRQGVRAA